MIVIGLFSEMHCLFHANELWLTYKVMHIECLLVCVRLIKKTFPVDFGYRVED